MTTDCIFCQIVAGQAPASVVHDDDIALAFMDIRPVTAGHLLVIPKQHSTYLAEMDESVGAHLFRVAMQLAAAVRGSGVRCEGINLFLADGVAAGQEVFHTHLHVIPRFAGDGFIVSADWQALAIPDRAELDALAQQIRAAGL